PSGRHQVTDVDREEAGGVEQLDDRGLGRGVVAGQEDYPTAARLVGIGAQDLRPKRVGGLYQPGTRDEIGDELAGGAAAEFGVPRVRRVDDSLAVPLQPADGCG